MTKMMKMTAIAVCVLSSLVADSLTVTVQCSNGQYVTNLPISVYDSAGTEVSGLTVTDSQGTFVINNSQNYQAPFNMFFTAKNGSMCGAYNINVNGSTGSVSLNYYPTELPCSCANY